MLAYKQNYILYLYKHNYVQNYVYVNKIIAYITF